MEDREVYDSESYDLEDPEIVNSSTECHPRWIYFCQIMEKAKYFFWVLYYVTPFLLIAPFYRDGNMETMYIWILWETALFLFIFLILYIDWQKALISAMACRWVYSSEMEREITCSREFPEVRWFLYMIHSVFHFVAIFVYIDCIDECSIM